ncbi:MAG TPA: glucoamylase family protein [Granulicella sp.]
MGTRGPRSISRRGAAKLMAGALAASVAAPGLGWAQAASAGSRNDFPLSPEEEFFLGEMQRAACLYFYEQADPVTGQVLDRAANRNPSGALDPRRITSIAATGFGLTALCIADKRNYLPFVDIRERVVRTLDFHLNKMEHQHGFFSHYNEVKTGRAFAFSEVSSIDTCILLCGVLTCREYFDDPKIKEMATQLYHRVEWPWMLNGGLTFSMGWRPDSAFIATRWDHYCELMMLYLLAIGSPTHGVDPSFWKNFSRPRIDYGPYVYIGDSDPLFVHQYSHAWFDFQGKRDAYADYFRNSVLATQAHKLFCLSLNRGYSDDLWGITASDWEHGYTAWGGPPLIGPVNGSVVPCAAAGSLPFLPEECLRVLLSMRQSFGERAWGRYGFCDCFHPELEWYDPDVLGIDLGIGLLMAENLRSGFVWKTFMQNPEALAAMQRVGFHDVT